MNFFTSGFKFVLLLAILAMGACAQPDDAGDRSDANLDMSMGANKVTADDYALQPIATGDAPLASVSADGQVAPFGMASRAKRAVKTAAVAEVAEPSATAEVAVPAIFAAQCVACHGADAKGVQGLGLDLTASQLIADSSAGELVEFLKAGRMPTDPASVTGIPMPGFAWLQAADLDEVAAYLKGL